MSQEKHIYKIYYRRYWETKNHSWECFRGDYEEKFLDEIKMLERYLELRDDVYTSSIKVLKSNLITYSDYDLFETKKNKESG